MQIIRCQDQIITKNSLFASVFMQRLFGLLNPDLPRILIFKTRFGIHTLFLKTPIDIIVLNNKMQVVKIKESIRPNRFFFWNPKHQYIVELPNGSIKKYKISLGNKFDFEPRIDS